MSVVERIPASLDGRPNVLGHLIDMLIGTGNPSDLIDAEAIKGILEARIRDGRGTLRYPRSVEYLIVDIGDQVPLYDQAREVYSSQPLTPETIVETRRLLWQVWAPRAEIEAAIPSFDERFVNIADHRTFEWWMTFVPDQIAKNSLLLGRIFPRVDKTLKNGLVTLASASGNNYKHLSYDGGWYEVEGVLAAPHLGTTEYGLKTIFDARGSVGQRMVTNVIASYENWVLRGHFFEEGRTWARLPGFLLGGKVVIVRCDGPLSIRDDYMPGSRSREVGGRSERFIPSTET